MVSHAEDKLVKNRLVKRAKKKQSCNDCKALFNTKTDLLHHRREEHSTRRENVCPLCKKTFESDKRLKMHASFHNAGGEYECFYCQKQFNKAWKMKIHLVNHSGRPSYICQYCGDDFLYPGKIVNHLKRIHDVWNACKECGEAISFDDAQHPHKCKIYGCKDCLMSFDCRSELAKHVTSHANEDNPTVATTPAISSTLPLLDNSQLESTKDLQADGSDRKIVKFYELGSLKHTGKVTENGICDSVKTHELNASENIESDAIQGLVIGQNVSEAPMFKIVDDDKNANENDDVLINIKRSEVLLKESTPPSDMSVINSCKEVALSSSFPSVLSKSTSDSSLGDFKVPATLNLRKRSEKSFKKSLRKRQEEIDKSLRKQEELLNELQFYVDTDAKITQRSQISLESWLTNDAFSSTDHDFVFGFEASVSDHHKESQHYFVNKKILKKEKADMTFEDLCDF